MKPSLYRPLTVVLATVVAAGFFASAGPSWVVEESAAQEDLPGEWQTRAPSSKNRLEASYAQAGGIFYLGGGTTARLGLTLHERYNPKTNSWSQVAPLPKGLHHIQSVELDGKVYYIGGFEGTDSGPHCQNSSNVYAYDPSTDTFGEGTSMPAGRARGASGVAVYGGKIYVAGGLYDDPDGVCDPVAVPWVDVYDPATGEWTQLPNMPRARNHFHGAVVDGKFYAIGGRQTKFIEQVSQVDVYDLTRGTAGSWQTPNTALPTSTRSGFATAVLGKEVLIIGGEGDSIAHKTVEAYDTTNNSWRTLEPMITGRHGTQAAVCNDGVYIATGGSKQGGSPTTVHEAFFLNGPTTCESPPDDSLPPVVTPPAPPPPPPNTAPVITAQVPAKTRDKTPTLSATITDAETNLAQSNIKVFLDNQAVTSFSYNAATDKLSFTSTKLKKGQHTLKIEATDEAEQSTTETAGFKVKKKK